jgi:hypothetical protein
MRDDRTKPSFRRALDAFFFGVGQAFNVSGSVVNRGRFGRGLAGDAEALAGDWRRSLDRANGMVRTTAARGAWPGVHER